MVKRMMTTSGFMPNERSSPLRRRAMVLGVEAVYGVKEGDVSKLTLLTSAAA